MTDEHSQPVEPVESSQQGKKSVSKRFNGGASAVGSGSGASYQNGSGYNKSYNGYNKNYNVRGGMNPMVPNMQWQGYYGNQPMYYGSNALHHGEDIKVPTSPTKKIEITTKTGEHLDLSAIHNKHVQAAVKVPNAKKENAGVAKTAEVAKPAEQAAPEEQEETLSEAEKNKRMFLEQIRLRKAALEKKKKGDEAPVQSTPVEQSSEQENAGEIKKELTFAEKLKLKKLQKLQDAGESEQTATPETEVPQTETEVPQAETEEQPQAVSTEATNPEEEKKDETPTEQKDDDATPAFVEDESDTRIKMTDFLTLLEDASKIEDIYTFGYPEDIEKPDDRYKKEHIKYTYGPGFLLQFKDKVNVKPDTEWVQSTASKIVIPPGMSRSNKSKDGKFGMGSRMGSSRDFSKVGSLRNMEGRSGSRNGSKRRSRRGGEKSNRAYTSRKDRELQAEAAVKEEPKVEVAPLVPSANRWVPKSKQKKAEVRYAPDGVTELLDKDEAKRRMKSLLNKLTLEKFDTISNDILAIANLSKWETNGDTLKVVIEELFHKACDEPHWSSMYAQLCGKLVKELNEDIKDDENESKSGPKLVLHYLVARCHTEFEKGWTDKLPTNEDGSPLEVEMMSDEYYQAAAAKRRGLGLVRFIGHLYRLNLLTGKMMFECFRRLMKDLNDNPSEETLESVIELLTTVGEQFETDRFNAGQAVLEGSVLLDSLFDILQKIIDGGNILSRIKFKLIDIKELREKDWSGAKKDEGPKTIAQIHEEEERNRQLKELKNSSRAGSRRNMSSMGSRTASKRDLPSISKDNFITTRSSSNRHSQRTPVKEEPKQPQMSASNMFSALMGADEEDDE